MGTTRKLLEKLSQGNIKKTELETLLARLGFEKFRGKGSHEVWGANNVPGIHIVIATHTKEVSHYQLRQIEKSLKKGGKI